jgi:hypothetical protein
MLIDSVNQKYESSIIGVNNEIRKFVMDLKITYAMCRKENILKVFTNQKQELPIVAKHFAGSRRNGALL